MADRLASGGLTERQEKRRMEAGATGDAHWIELSSERAAYVRQGPEGSESHRQSGDPRVLLW
jgi:hypothetical protein